MANVELGSSNLKEVYDAINANSGSSVDTTNLAKLNEENIFLHTQSMPRINTGSIHSDLGLYASFSKELNLSLNTGDSSDVRVISMQNTDGIQLTSSGTSHNTNITLSSLDTSINRGDRSISFGGPDANNIIISHTPTITNLTEWEYMSDYEVPVKKHIVESVIPNINNLAKLNKANTFQSDNTFYGNVFIGGCSLYYSGYTDKATLRISFRPDSGYAEHNVELISDEIYMSANNGKGIILDSDGAIEIYARHGDIFIGTDRYAGNSGNVTLSSSENLEISCGGTITMDAHTISEFKRVLGIS